MKLLCTQASALVLPNTKTRNRLKDALGRERGLVNRRLFQKTSKKPKTLWGTAMICSGPYLTQFYIATLRKFNPPIKARSSKFEPPRYHTLQAANTNRPIRETTNAADTPIQKPINAAIEGTEVPREAFAHYHGTGMGSARIESFCHRGHSSVTTQAGEIIVSLVLKRDN